MTPRFFLRTILLGLCLANAAAYSASPVDSSVAPLKQITPKIFEIGSIQLNKENKTIKFPASVNMTNGAVEYVLVTGTGKLHESIFKTETEPSQIHVAMLLLGATGAGTNIAGDKFAMDVSWKNGAVEKHLRAEEFIFNSKSKSAMSKEIWIYNGSKVIDGTFIAQRDGSIVSIISDPLALANCLQPDRDNDEIWFVNTNAIPPLNTKVEVTFKLEGAQEKAKDTK
ncbi:MAG: YdjY domain-containing protein [Verrucomicrobiota bacterium]